VTDATVYDRARLLRLRPPLWCGGHGWVTAGPHLLRCERCLALVPRWAVVEGFAQAMAGRWCPGLLAQLTTGVG
jgi:hypothetical protein